MRTREIRKIRQTYKWTQEQIARALQVSPQAIYYWESGTSRPSRYDLIIFKRLQEMLRNRADKERAKRAIELGQKYGLRPILILLFGTGEPMRHRRKRYPT